MSLADAIAASGGIPSAFAKDDTIGATITGVVESADLRQTTHYETGEPETWQDGNPKQQVVVTLQTDQRDPALPDDDGKRRVYIKWWGDQKKQLLAAIKAAGVGDLLPGGTFTATFTGLGEAPNPRLNQPKLFTYRYQAPPTGLAQAVAEQPQRAAPTAPAAPAEVWGPPTPTADQPDKELQAKVTQMRGLGLADPQIAAALGVDIALIAETPF
ncbi:hypothetical protein OVA14_07115 [Agrococcus sp. SL85]|uniref:hypothetical protein n=1 Tax=Agrococcus sp. SL85 TaxID=2995141 RepID=UPI00226C9CED|nr:hypothetical protein [Agrococcus sp. SL85]WAC65163.1 hypothetical protein OVA14_07115 [Agrococcus sp. SL85]